MEEKWLDILNYEGSYQVSNLGNVRSLPRRGSDGRKLQGRTMKPYSGTCGYLQVDLRKDGTTHKHLVHRLVAQAFLENPDNLPEVNHKDECKLNNMVDNLEWISSSDNHNYGTYQERQRASHLGKHWKLVEGKRIYY